MRLRPLLTWKNFIALCVIVGGAFPAFAEENTFQTAISQVEGATSGRIVQVVLAITILSLAPGIIVMVTCFTRFIIALSFLRTGLGLPSTPANIILISLALFMTLFVMGPTFDKAWDGGVMPLLKNQITEEEAYIRVVDPFRSFMRTNTRPKDLDLMAEISNVKIEKVDAKEPPLRVLIPAFMISELRRGFEIGFLIMLPFLVIDLIVATLTLSMGMMLLSPTVISLPFKVMFFVLIDGWNLLIGGLLRSFV